MPKPVIVSIPAWCKDMPDHYKLGSAELAKELRCSQKSISNCVKHGTLPPPDMRCARYAGIKLYWTLGTLRRFMATHSAGAHS